MAIEQIGKFKVLPKGSKINSIALQTQIVFVNNEIIEITNNIDNLYYFKLKKQLFYGELIDSHDSKFGPIDISNLENYYPQYSKIDDKKESIKSVHFNTDEEYNDALISEKEQKEAALDYFENYEKYSKFDKKYFNGL